MIVFELLQMGYYVHAREQISLLILRGLSRKEICFGYLFGQAVLLKVCTWQKEFMEDTQVLQNM